MVLFAHDHVFYKTITENYYSNGGLSYEVLKRYIEVFGEVKVIARTKIIDENFEKLSLASGEKVHIIGIENFKNIRNFYKIFYAKKKIEEEVKKSKYLIARLPSSIGMIAIEYAKKHNIPYMIEVVGCPFDALKNYGSMLGKVLAPIEAFRMKKELRLASDVIYITKEFLQKRYPTNGRIEICPNVNLVEAPKKVLKKRLLKINKISENEVIKIGLIGSLDVAYKGHKTLIKAIELLKKENINLEVEFLGKGNSKTWKELAIKLKVSDNVKFIGSLPSGECVYEWIDTLDICVQPSLAEAQGRSIIEAMSRGCPVIATKVGGIVELIDSNYLIEKGNFEELAFKIKALVGNREKMKIQAEKNFSEAKFYLKESIDDKRRKFLSEFKKR